MYLLFISYFLQYWDSNNTNKIGVCIKYQIGTISCCSIGVNYKISSYLGWSYKVGCSWEDKISDHWSYQISANLAHKIDWGD